MKNTFTELFVNRPHFTRNHSRALIMKISQVYILIMISAIITMASPRGNGQAIETTTVDLEIINEPLKKVFKEIEKQTGFLFHWTPGKVSSYKKISLPGGTYTVKKALDLALQGTGLKYEQNKKNYILIFPVKEKEDTPKKIPENKIEQPEKSAALITGTVTDASNQEPLAGVNIIVKGTTKGTTTDADGKFIIDAEDNEVLVFSFIGFKAFETQVSGRSVIDVTMEVDITALQEVEVNAGYWQIKKEEQTGNIKRVDGEEIQKQPISNLLQALTARMPGVFVQQMDGLPGSNIRVEIRGKNSLRSNGNDPLYIVDGVPYPSTSLHSSGVNSPFLLGTSPLNAINPADIESIEVLKDADATAIYGSRGANGIVLITTKRGNAGNTKIDVNLSMGAGTVTRMMDLLNTEQYVAMRKEALKNDGAAPADWLDYDLTKWDTTRNTDWQEVFLGGTSHTMNAQASISGGDKNTQFFIGGGYYRLASVFPDDGSHWKGSGHFNLSHAALNEKLKVILSGSYISENNDMSASDFTGQAINLPPNAPAIHDENGNLNWENNTWYNPFAAMLRRYESTTDNLITNLSLSYQFIQGLRIKTNVGYNATTLGETSTRPLRSFNPSSGVTQTGTGFGNGKSRTWIIEPQLEYKKNISKGILNILVGTTFQRNASETSTLFADGITSDALLKNPQAATTFFPSFDFSEYKYSAIFGRINYILKDRYIINLTGRRDGSSRFGPDRQFANFGAAGVAWIFSNEDFIRDNLTLFSFGKIRASYGTTGSDQIGNYQFLDTYSPTQRLYQNGSGLIPTRLANPDYSWETSKKLETAVELGLLENLISLEISWYRNRSSNQLVGYSLPQITGFSSIQYNLPATIQNTGWEFDLNASILKSQSLSWTIGINLTIPRNKLLEYPNIEGSSYTNTYKVGESLNARKTYQLTGVDPATGLYTFKDLNEDGSYSLSGDGQFLKEAGINFYGGIQNTIQYEGFQLDFLFQFVKQTGRNYLFAGFLPPGIFFDGRGNQPDIVMNRWQKEGDVTDIQRFTTIYSQGLPKYTLVTNSDKTIEDSSFIRLKNISLSYTLPAEWSNRLLLENTRVYIQGQNLLTITNYNGGDPENMNPRVLPPLRILTFGVHLTF